MEKIEYQRLFERETFYWWNIGRREILKSVLRRHLASQQGFSILDIGCGAGGNIKILGEFGSVIGLDVSEEALKFANKHGAFKELILGDAEHLPFPDGAFGLVSAFDVLEHISDDQKAIREMFRVLQRGGFALITVPAHRWLWSRHDEALHHLRRYTDKELRAVVSVAGFIVITHSHFVTPAIAFLLIRKLIRRIKFLFNITEITDTYDVVLPRPLNTALIWWLLMEKVIMRILPIPFGSSLVIFARKP